MPIAAAAIIGGATIAGSYMTNQQSAANSAAANATSIDLANTSYKRRVEDLKSAGLNPMLAYSQGGAAVPNMSVPPVVDAVAQGANSAVSGYNAANSANLIKAQIKTQETQQAVNNGMAIKAMTDADLSVATAAEVRARTETYPMSIARTMAEIDKIAQDTKLSFHQTHLVKVQVTNAMLHGDNIVADTGNKLADNQIKALNYTLGKSRVNAAQNASNAADTFFGRNIAPFLPSFLDSSAAAKNVGGIVK